VGLREEGEGLLNLKLFFGGQVVLFGEFGAAFSRCFCGGGWCGRGLLSLGSLDED
jgi:hypothetical protein